MKDWTVGILTPFVDGFYFGDIMWGITREAKLYDIKLITFMTFIGDHEGVRMDYNFQIGWDLPDVWLVIADAVTGEYVKELSEKTGKPIITVANQFKEVDTFVVKCDNRESTVHSTQYLISLGHSRIAFIGDLMNSDTKERFDGYRDALEQANLVFDNSLLFESWSGKEAAQYYDALGMPCTAMVVANDTIAIDLIEALKKRGYKLPDDLAIIGFDDIGGASRCQPLLTTVRQPTIDLGSTALRRSMEVLNGRLTSPDTTLIPVKLIVRQSCGSQTIDHSINDQTLTSQYMNEADLSRMVESQFEIGQRAINSQDLSWLRSTNQHWGCLTFWNREPDQIERYLKVERITSFLGSSVIDIGEMFSEHQFPPLDIIPIKSSRDGSDIAIVQTVNNDKQMIGCLVTVGPINERLLRGYETRNLPNLLGIIHDRQKLLIDLQIREASNTALLEKLEIVSRTTNDGVFELHINEDRVDWITGVEHMFGVTKEELPISRHDLMEYIHPEDVQNVSAAWNNHYIYHVPIEIEFRIKGSTEYLWVFLAGEAIFDDEGSPIRLIASITDIHTRKQAENALVASEEKYRDFFINTPVMILSLDKAFLITDANPFWLESMEYVLENVLGHHCIDFLTPESQQIWIDEWQNHASRELSIMDMELQWVSQTGNIIDGLVNCKYFTDLDGHRTYLTVRDITERKIAEQQIYQLAYQDSLTGLANRRHFYEKLEEAIVMMDKNEKIAIMMIDLDHFKVVNDSLGHNIGDELLCSVAEVILNQIHSRGLVARIGGDEFMVMIKDSQVEFEIEEIMERILSHLQLPFHLNGHEHYITASIGLSWFPTDGMDITELIKMADTAMYRAKQQGRNRSVTYSSAMGLGVNDQLTIGNKLHKAVEKMLEFRLFYQPQIDMKTGMMIGVEALIRWNDPARGIISPDQFIPLAEENGLIVPIGNWVISEACRQLKKWEHLGNGYLCMAINISGKQLQQLEFLSTVDRILAESRVNPERLCFEITETIALQNMDVTSKVIDELILRGIHIALDDFGTGYSSLSVLNKLPLRVIKIDRSFVSGIEREEDSNAIVKAIMAMSRSMKLMVLAEGVETEQQRRILQDLGCDAYQGYLISKPIPSEQMEQWLLSFAKNGKF
jgi:diguanylate cyclase (GGDEF)-like protein/PAS domain S-box-containing protein